MRRTITVAGVHAVAAVSTLQPARRSSRPLRPAASLRSSAGADFTLATGFVLLVERHSLPIVSARFIVDAGACASRLRRTVWR